jgi:hypothetical protein
LTTSEEEVMILEKLKLPTVGRLEVKTQKDTTKLDGLEVDLKVIRPSEKLDNLSTVETTS